MMYLSLCMMYLFTLYDVSQHMMYLSLICLSASHSICNCGLPMSLSLHFPFSHSFYRKSPLIKSSFCQHQQFLSVIHLSPSWVKFSKNLTMYCKKASHYHWLKFFSAVDVFPSKVLLTARSVNCSRFLGSWRLFDGGWCRARAKFCGLSRAPFLLSE